MSWRSRSNLGEQMVAAVHDLLRMDDQWLIDRPDGFTWWAGDYALTVTTDQGVFRQTQVTYRLHAQTDFLKGRGHLRELGLALEHEMDSCSMSGPVYDMESDTFRMHCSVYAFDDNAPWLTKLFAAAVALQVAEAHDIGARLSRQLHAVPAASEHPAHGHRAQPCGILSQIYGFFKPAGAHASNWIGKEEEWKVCNWAMEREASSHQGDGSTRLDARFPWEATSDGEITFEVRTDEPHPITGHGLHMTLIVPMRMSEEGVAQMSLELNQHERHEYKRCHTIGSWCLHEGRLAHRLFVPNSLYAPELLHELCVMQATRAIWVNEYFLMKKMQASKATLH